MSYDVLKLCKDKGDHYEVDPAVMFPATIARIKEVLDGNPPIELAKDATIGVPWFDPVVKQFYDEAKGFPGGAWDLAAIPFQSFSVSDMGDDNTKLLIEQRSAVLSFAESWFKRALALQAGKGIRIHILNNPDYRR